MRRTSFSPWHGCRKRLGGFCTACGRTSTRSICGHTKRSNKSSSRWEWVSALLAGAQIMAVVAKARADATAKAAQAAAAIAKLGPQIGINPAPGSGRTGGPPHLGTDPVDPKLRGLQNMGFGGGRGPDGMSTGRQPNVPEAPVPENPPPPKIGGEQGVESHNPGEQHAEPEGQGRSPGEVTGAGDGLTDPNKHAPKFGMVQGSENGGVVQGPLPFGGPGTSGSPVPAGISGGGGLGGFKMPEAPGGMGGLGGGGLPSQGLTSGAGFSPGAGGMPPAAPPSDFSRGLGSGLGGGGGPAPFAPPVSPSASSAATSGGPAGALPSSPAPVAAAGGSAVSTPPPTPMAAPAASGMGGAAVPAGPVGPLPPFGSDVPRSPVGSTAAVSRGVRTASSACGRRGWRCGVVAGGAASARGGRFRGGCCSGCGG